MKTVYAKVAVNTEPELLAFSALLAMLGRRSRQGIYDLMRRDPSFPRPIRISEFSIAWRRSEVLAWIDSRPRVEMDGVGAVEQRRRAKEARKED